LLVAPAGYGKTTLARQWLEEAGGAWITATPASADLALLARDLAAAIGELIAFDSRRVEAALSAGRTADEQVRAVGRVILGQIKDPVEGWIVVDDYHLLMGNPAAEELIATLEESGRFRFLIASRERPAWATSRRRIYMETVELDASELALDDGEVAELLPPDRRTAALRRQARGWPAVIGLAAYADSADVPLSADTLSDTLYDFLAEEMYERASLAVQRTLSALPALPPVTPAELSVFLAAPEAVSAVLSTGLAYEDAGRIVIHPLARGFLLTKLRDRPDAAEVAHAGFDFAYERGLYDEAFRLVEELGLDDCLERLIVASYAELMRTGRIATLEELGRHAISTGSVPQSLIDLITAELELIKSNFGLSYSLGIRAAEGLPECHALRARGFLISGRAAYFLYRYEEAVGLHERASAEAMTIDDINDSAWGVYIAAHALEDDRMFSAAERLEALDAPRQTDRIRVATARRQLALMGSERSLHADSPDRSTDVVKVSDPWVRSAWSYALGNSLLLQARYSDAQRIQRATLSELDEFGLSFGLPHVEWSLAAAELGLRHFARCGALLRKVEGHASHSSDLHVQLNVRVLRARMMLAQLRPQEAIEITAANFDAFPKRSMYGEYLATRALAQAVVGDYELARRSARLAESTTRSLDTKVLCATVNAILALEGAGDELSTAQSLLSMASRFAIWDPIVCGVRAWPPLVSWLAKVASHQHALRDVLLRSNDLVLARLAGLVTRSTGSRGVLSGREREILDYVEQGRTNGQIAASLVISPATVKSHMDHIFDKLGVRSRAEAVARYAEIERAETVVSDAS
jgi:ATP/maltotriose-dependent transcriptional regulator MalT